MFKLLQSLMGGESREGKDLNSQSLESTSAEIDNVLAKITNSESSQIGQELLLQQGKLKESLSSYDREIKDNPDSLEVYEQLLSHLKQQDSVADAYKKLAESLQKQGQGEEAASCYRQAIVIQAVTTEAKGKYQDIDISSKLAPVAKVADLKSDAFSFQGSIKEDKPQQQPNLLQIELPPDYNLSLSLAAQTRKIDSRKIATVEWEAAQVFMQKALDSCDREEWTEVALACEQATKIVPGMAEAYKIWGNALQRMNRTAEAMECYGKAVEIEPDLAEVYAAIAKLYAQQQKWESATEYYQKAIVIKPEFPTAYRCLANVWEQLGEEQKANVCHLRAEELEAKNPRITTSQVEDPAQSTAETTEKLKVPQLKASSVAEYQQLAQKSETNQNWQKAAAYYRQALDLKLTETKALKASPATSKRSKQLTHLQSLKEVIKNQPVPDRSPRKSLNTIEATAFSFDTQTDSRGSKSWAQAIGNYQKQAKLKPDSASVQVQLGDLYAKKKKWQPALACYSKAIRIDPKKAEAHLKLAKILGKTGNHASYVEHMYLAYTIKPSFGSDEDHFMLGNALKKLGHRNKAIVCYEQAIRLQPHYIDAYQNLAKVYREIGKPNNAISCYQAAIRHNPQNANFYNDLGDLYVTRNLWDEAVKYYRVVLELQPKYPQATQKLNHALSEKLRYGLSAKRHH